MEEEAYLDSNIFLYPILDPGIKGEKASQFLEKVIEGKFWAATSVLTFDEVFWTAKKEGGHEDAVRAGEAILGLSNLRFLDANLDTIFKAFEIIKETKLDPRDAIHASSALLAGIRLIVSDDTDFDRVKGLKRKSVVD